MATLFRSALAFLWSYCLFSRFYVFFFSLTVIIRFPMYITKENERNVEKYRKRNIKLIKELRMI